VYMLCSRSDWDHLELIHSSAAGVSGVAADATSFAAGDNHVVAVTVPIDGGSRLSTVQLVYPDRKVVKIVDVPDVYIAKAWAGSKLIVGRSRGEGALDDLLIVEGSEVKILQENAFLMGVAPDASQVIFNSFSDAGEQLIIQDLSTGLRSEVEAHGLGITDGIWSEGGVLVTTLGSSGSGMAMVDPMAATLTPLPLDGSKSPNWSVPFIASDGTTAAIGSNGVVLADPKTGELPSEPHLVVVCRPGSACQYIPFRGNGQLNRVYDASGGEVRGPL
jgi:hypothetical protein